MPLQIVRNDITKMKVDAIVNAANCSLLGGGGVDGCIHRAAGPKLLAECRTLGGCDTGSAKITGAYNLPCRYVIHAVGPRWQGGTHHEKELLTSCYRTSLALAKEAGCETVAFPLISSGIYGYPKDQALRVAVDTIGEFLLQNHMTVFLVVFDRKSYRISARLFADIEEYIDERYVEAHTDSLLERLRSRNILPHLPHKASPMPKEAEHVPDTFLLKDAERVPDAPPRGDAKRAPGTLLPRDAEHAPGTLPLKDAERVPDAHPLAESGYASATSSREYAASGPLPSAKPASLEEAMRQLDESFSEMLLRKIDESGMTDAQCYKKANIDRKLFSKIRSDRLYRPSKPTVIAFAIALELSLAETKDMLRKAGFALSHSSKFDIIIEFFIERANYNVFEINEALFAFDQSLLGA